MTGKLRDCGRMQATIEGIAKVHDFDLYAPADGESLILLNEPYQDLHICRYAKNEISVAHWATQNGDMIADPEILFYILQNNSTRLWLPLAIRQFPIGAMYDGRWRDCLEVEDGEVKGIYRKAYGEVVSFSTMWSTNIRQQGFYTPEKKNKHGLYAAPKKERRIEPIVEVPVEALPEPEEPKRVKFVTLELEL